MSEAYAAQDHAASQGFAPQAEGTAGTVMSVLREIRAVQSNGLFYDETTNLADAGFTSVEMVKVMLGVEAAFDLMIPQEMITPENFTSAATITEMVKALVHRN